MVLQCAASRSRDNWGACGLCDSAKCRWADGDKMVSVTLGGCMVPSPEGQVQYRKDKFLRLIVGIAKMSPRLLLGSINR